MARSIFARRHARAMMAASFGSDLRAAPHPSAPRWPAGAIAWVPAASLACARSTLLKTPAEIIANAREMLGPAAPLREMARGRVGINMPVVILQGERDASVPHVTRAAKLAEGLPNAEREPKPGMEHRLHRFLQDDLARAVAGIEGRAG